MEKDEKESIREIFDFCFKGGDDWFYALFPLTFPIAFVYFLIFWLAGVKAD